MLWVPIGYFSALFIAAQIFLPLILGIPRAVLLFFKGRIKIGVLGPIFLKPLIWVLALFALSFSVGFFSPETADKLYANAALNLSLNLGTLSILLSPISRKSRADFWADFEGTFNRYYTEAYFSDTLKSKRDRYADIAGEVAEFLAEHTVHIGDSQTLPYPKREAMYAVKWGIMYWEKRVESVSGDDAIAYRRLISSLGIAFTLLARDWHEIDPSDKDAIAKLNACKEFPAWALSLKSKYLNEKAASEEALTIALQVMEDDVREEKRRSST